MLSCLLEYGMTDWELRRYEATKWVATNATAMSRDTVNSDMFHKLFLYISGNNVKGVKIPMTAPVATQVIHGAGPNCESDFVMHFMLPHAYWPSPIQPKDASVFIAEMPAMDVYVR
ncbi:heme-binding protein 2-like [Aplysia californica]|uniref:Heme-binding protein 2-like n=1 Tax=Aplysia californica TaxID=6500 RepID=A0ABM0ZYR5_APLCA|nr:heme-binding protein 2-like [Aplysia californica]